MIVTEPPHLRPASGTLPAARTPAPFRKRGLSRFLALATNTVGVSGNVSVLLTDDDGIRRLNRQFRKKDKATDVLSFPAAQLPWDGKGSKRKLAGDLAISLTTAAKQAEAFGHTLEVEIKILLLHGLLHLSGLDHEIDNGEMARKEAALRKRFELPMGLIARSDAKTQGSNAQTQVSKTRSSGPRAASSRARR